MKINKIKPKNYTLFVKYLPQKRKDGLKDNARFQIRLIALERKAEGILPIIYKEFFIFLT